MNNLAEILNELKDIAPLLASLEKVNVYTVPEGYFDNLPSEVADLAIAMSGEEFASTKKNVQNVPEGYFDSLSTNILAKIKELYPETAQEELRKLSPALYSLQGENVFTVPGGYFNSLAGDILEKLEPKVKGKVVAMKQRGTWLKIAVAAVVTGIIAISSLQLFNHSSNSNGNSQSAITASANVPDYVKESFQFKTTKQLNEGIAKLSDDDIIKYLEKNGNIMDNELLLKNTDVSELPDQADYLLDENALNSYLQKIQGTTKAD